MARAPRRVRARAGRHWRRGGPDDPRRPRRRAAGRPRRPRRRHRRLQRRPDERAAGRPAEHPLLPADPLARRGRCPPRALARHARLPRPGRRRPATRHGRGTHGVAMLCTKVIQQLDELLDKPDAEWPLAEPARAGAGDPRPAAGGHRPGDPARLRALPRRDRRRDRPERAAGRSARASAHIPGWRRGVSAPDPRAHLARHRPGGGPRHRSRGDPADRRRVRRARCPTARHQRPGRDAARPARGPGAALHDPRGDRGDRASVAGACERRHR